jgi:hypothetical protein
VLIRADRTAPKGLTRAEMQQSERSGRQPDRTVLYQRIRNAAAAARSEAEFFDSLKARDVLVRLRPHKGRPGEATGYAVALNHGRRRRPVRYSGGQLAADLTLPKLRHRWAGPRLSGRGMTGAVAQAVLAREALRAARSALSETEFFVLLGQFGLIVRLQSGPSQPGHSPEWSATLPGLIDRSAKPAWFTGGTLDPSLELGELRARWQAGQAGAAPGPDYFTGAARAEVYEHAARAAVLAARDLEAGRPADSAWAAADLLTATAEATGNSELSQAAEAFTRAARAAWGRVPAPSLNGQMLRTAAYLIASCQRTSRRELARAVRVMLTALAGLARTLAKLRTAQARRQQAAAASAAAAQLADVAATVDYGETVPGLASIAFPGQPQAGLPALSRGSAPRRRPRPHAPGRGLSA